MTSIKNETDTRYEARQKLVKPLGTLIHHIFAHSGVLTKLEGKEANIARREEITREVAQLVHQRPAKGALNLLIEQYGEAHVPSLLHLSHELYESLGEDQTHKLMKLSGLDLEHLRKTADVEHVLANISNVVIAANPAVVNNLLAAKGMQKDTAESSKEAPLKQQAKTDKKMTAREKEKSKSAKEKAKDWAYTINHAIYCLIGDSLQGDPVVEAYGQKKYGADSDLKCDRG